MQGFVLSSPFSYYLASGGGKYVTIIYKDVTVGDLKRQGRLFLTIWQTTYPENFPDDTKHLKCWIRFI